MKILYNPYLEMNQNDCNNIKKGLTETILCPICGTFELSFTSYGNKKVKSFTSHIEYTDYIFGDPNMNWFKSFLNELFSFDESMYEVYTCTCKECGATWKTSPVKIRTKEGDRILDTKKIYNLKKEIYEELCDQRKPVTDTDIRKPADKLEKDSIKLLKLINRRDLENDRINFCSGSQTKDSDN